MKPLSDTYVEETRFGFWFLRSHTWQHHVLRVAINDLRGLFSEAPPANPVLLTAKCTELIVLLVKAVRLKLQLSPISLLKYTLLSFIPYRIVNGVVL